MVGCPSRQRDALPSGSQGHQFRMEARMFDCHGFDFVNPPGEPGAILRDRRAYPLDIRQNQGPFNVFPDERVENDLSKNDRLRA